MWIFFSWQSTQCQHLVETTTFQHHVNHSSMNWPSIYRHLTIFYLFFYTTSDLLCYRHGLVVSIKCATECSLIKQNKMFSNSWVVNDIYVDYKSDRNDKQQLTTSPQLLICQEIQSSDRWTNLSVGLRLGNTNRIKSNQIKVKQHNVNGILSDEVWSENCEFDFIDLNSNIALIWFYEGFIAKRDYVFWWNECRTIRLFEILEFFLVILIGGSVFNSR